MTNRIRIQHLFRTISELHISSPDKGFYVNTETGNITTKRESGNFPITRTHRLAVALTEGASEVLPEGERGNRSFPVITANEIRGFLRRAAADIIEENLIERNEKISLESQHILRCGAATGQPSGVPPTVEEAREALSHPYLGLFGGSPKLVRGALSSGTGWPVTLVSIASDLVPDLFQDRCVTVSGGSARTIYDTYNLTQAVYIARKDDALGFTDRNAPVVIRDYQEELSKWQALLSKTQEARDAERAGAEGSTSKIDLRGISAMEVVSPGVHFYSDHYINTQLIGSAGLGLYIQAVCRFANNGQIGGGNRLGFGRFELESFITLDGQRIPLLVRNEHGQYEPNIENAVIGEAVDAASSAVANMTGASLEKVFGLNDLPKAK